MQITESKLRRIIREVIIEGGIVVDNIPNKDMLDDYLSQNLESLVDIVRNSRSKPGRIGLRARRDIIKQVKEGTGLSSLTHFESSHIMGRVADQL